MSLSDDLASLFLEASQASGQRLTDLGIPLTMPYVQTSVSRDRRKSDAWSSYTYENQQNALAHQATPLHTVIPLLTPEVAAMVLRCAQELVAAPESKLPFWSPFGSNGRLLISDPAHSTPAEYSTDAAGWTSRHLLLPALYGHLVGLPSLDSAATDAAENFAKDVLSVATADHLSYRAIVPIAGLDIRAKTDPMSLGKDAILRRLTADEQGNILRDWGIGSSVSGPIAFTALPLTALQIDISAPRDKQNPDTRENAAKWLCALQLCGYSVAGHFAIFGSLPRWVLPIRMNMPLALANQPRKWSIISDAGARKVAEVGSKLSNYHITEPASEHDLALHRFHTGLARLNAVDSVLDFVIALESLLLPYDENARHGDLSYRFRVHGAHYIAKARNRREEVAKQLTNLYGLRSRLVHGGKYPTAAEIEAGRLAAEELVRQGLLRAVNEGFPTAAAFKKSVLGV